MAASKNTSKAFKVLKTPDQLPVAEHVLGDDAKLNDAGIAALIAQFEAAVQLDNGVEFWSARDLQILFGYASSWQNFSSVIERAKKACEATEYAVSNHFNDVINMVGIGLGASREVGDVFLSRYACYLVAQNGDSRKRAIAYAQTYFAVQTRRQELRDADDAAHTPLTEDQKRLLLRSEIREHNKRLAEAAKTAGVIKPLDFAVFQNHGYKGMYGGLDRLGIAQTKGLKSKDNILDHMGSTEMAANLFRATQAEDKLRRENIRGKTNANQAHFIVGQKVRQAIKDIGGTMPERLPSAENIAKVEKRVLAQGQNKSLELAAPLLSEATPVKKASSKNRIMPSAIKAETAAPALDGATPVKRVRKPKES